MGRKLRLVADLGNGEFSEKVFDLGDFWVGEYILLRNGQQVTEALPQVGDLASRACCVTLIHELVPLVVVEVI